MVLVWAIKVTIKTPVQWPTYQKKVTDNPILVYRGSYSASCVTKRDIYTIFSLKFQSEMILESKCGKMEFNSFNYNFRNFTK